MAKTIHWYEYWSKKKEAKNDFEKAFFKFIIMKFLEKLWKIQENKDITLVTKRRRRRNYLVSEPNYHTTKFFTENVLATKTIKNRDTNE